MNKNKEENLARKVEVSAAAAALGRIKTPKKAKTSRENGTQPCHEGKRRGRPTGKII